MKLSEYIQLDGTKMAKLVRQKEVTKQELIETSYELLDKVNPELNAVTRTRKEQAHKEADKQHTEAPFNGVPIFLKDISQTIRGELSTGGALLLKNAVAPTTSYFVESLNRAGFLRLGHSTTPEFALKNITESKLYGPTRNPWNHDHSPGGSSGGAAALVASGV